MHSLSLTDTYYGCDYQLECGDNNGDGVWYHNNRSISNTTLKSVGFDDAGRYQCKNPSNEVYDDLTLHVYGESSDVVCVHASSVGT